MIQAMFSGISGMKAFKSDLDIIGNNIANVNTVGYKSSRATFKDMLSLTVASASAPNGGAGGVSPSQIGLGVKIGTIERDDTQGSMTSTGKPTDAAIKGTGYFVLGNGSRSFYSRDGSFTTDAQNNLVSSSTGMKVLGWAADELTGAIDTSKPVTASSSIKVPIGGMSVAKQTSLVNLSGNLNASAPEYVDDKTTPNSKYPLKFDVYDSLGVTHSLDVTFTKIANIAGTPPQAAWSYSVSSPDGGAAPLATGNIAFDSLGYSTLDSVPININLTNSTGATNPFKFDLNMKKLSQLNGSSTADMNYQDGLALGTLESYNLDGNGKVIGVFTNGSTRTLGQIALAEFNNPAGLSKIGDNMMVESSNSGAVRMGIAGEGSLGSISAGYLEASNVDLTSEFANMIVAQRGFQANSKLISTSDEVLQEIMALKR